MSDQASAYIQWKGTEVCMDFTCKCGESFHIDADFLYAVQCRACGQLYEMPPDITPVPVDSTTFAPWIAPEDGA